MDDTIAAIATLVGESSINVIRISGSKSISIVNNLFSENLNKAKSNTINYGFIINKNEKIDEVLVSVFRSPKSFTKEDVVEINTHGGVLSVNKIMELLLNSGARLAQPGEFLKRAFLNGRIDLVEAEAVSDLINAKSESARKMSMKGISSELSKKIKEIRNSLLELIANIEVNIDYPEYEDALIVTNKLISEKIKTAKVKISELLDGSKNGVMIKNGINIAIVGKPNVGKSSLLNKLLGEEKAIVTDIEGTTRDIVEGSIVINGINVNLYDTAGIRETTEIVESIGVKKSLDKIDESDAIMFVVDGDTFSLEDKSILDKLKDKKVLVIYNKSDINNNKFKELNVYDYVDVSVYDEKSVNLLKKKISDIFELNKIETSDLTYVSNIRQIGLLNKCVKIIDDIEHSVSTGTPVDLVEIDIKLLWETLGEITGNVYKEELLDEIFSKFCLGK